MNFDDPLNIEAAELYMKDKEAFRVKVREYVAKFAKRWELMIAVDSIIDLFKTFVQHVYYLLTFKWTKRFVNYIKSEMGVKVKRHIG